MSTLHSRDAVGAITMLGNYGLSDYEIAANLEVVIAQLLVRKLCQYCKVQHAPTAREKDWFQRMGQEVPEAVWAPAGCAQCAGIGFLGRVGGLRSGG